VRFSNFELRIRPLVTPAKPLQVASFDAVGFGRFCKAGRGRAVRSHQPAKNAVEASPAEERAVASGERPYCLPLITWICDATQMRSL